MLRDKMLALIKEVNGELAEREELVTAIAVALLTGKNLFILGDTGQAKSYAINRFRHRISGARQFERLLSKQADEEQLFGRIDLASLIPGNADQAVLSDDPSYKRLHEKLQAAYEKYQGIDQEKPEYDESLALEELKQCQKRVEICSQTLYALHGNKPRLITTGKIADSHIVFLDEIFKANDGILNSLLTALNERRYTNEGETIGIPVISFFSASNEVPNFNDPAEKILQPLYDRFELKLVTQYVEQKAERLRILAEKQAGASGQITATITLEELYLMQEEVRNVIVSPSINELMDDILCALRDKDIHVSDRKYFGFYPLAQAIAWLTGRNQVESADLLILKHYLWTEPEEISTIEPLLAKMCINPLQQKAGALLESALESFKDFEQTAGTVDNVKRINKFRQEMVVLFEEATKLGNDAVNAGQQQQIDELTTRLEDLNKRACEASCSTYLPLPEVKGIFNNAA